MTPKIWGEAAHSGLPAGPSQAVPAVRQVPLLGPLLSPLLGQLVGQLLGLSRSWRLNMQTLLLERTVDDHLLENGEAVGD